MRLLRRLAVALGLLLLLGAGWLAWSLTSRPDLSLWEARYALRPAPPPDGSPRITAEWLGVATLVLSDGTTTLLTDGFFTRVGVRDLLLRRPVAPDREAIERGLERAGVERAAAVMVVHSHYDHAMDAPEVARRTGALVMGSRSTANVARGQGLPEQQILEVVPGEAYPIGDFTVVFHRSRHVPLPFGQGGIGEEISRPLVPPVPVEAWVEGGSWSIEVRHPLGTLLVQGSAGWTEGGLEGVQADTVLLGIGNLGRQGAAYREGYYRELLDRVGARRVIPIHWDDFVTRPPGVVEAPPYLFGDPRPVFEELLARPGLELRLLPPWQPVVLFGEADAAGR